MVDRRKKIKRELGERYRFCQIFPERKIRKAELVFPGPQTVASLTVGCVRIESRLYPDEGSLKPAWYVFVKDDPVSPDWIFYESPEGPASGKEREMFRVLDQIVRRDHLSYTECCFERLEGCAGRADREEKK